MLEPRVKVARSSVELCLLHLLEMNVTVVAVKDSGTVLELSWCRCN